MADYGVTSHKTITNAIRPMLAESVYTLEHKPVVPNTVRQYTLKQGDGEKWQEPKYGTVTAFDLIDGVDMQQAQKITDSIRTVTPNEVGCQVLFPKRSLRIVRDDMFRTIGRLMGDAMARKEDGDGIAMFPGFSVSLGGAGVGLTMNYVLAAGSILDGQTEQAPGKRYGCLHSHMLHPLAKNLAPNGTYPVPEGISAQTLRDAFRFKTVGGENWLIDNNIPRDASDDAKGAVYSSEALILVKGQVPELERDYDSSLRMYEFNMVADYAFGEVEDQWGVQMYFDAVRPTS